MGRFRTIDDGCRPWLALHGTRGWAKRVPFSPPFWRSSCRSKVRCADETFLEDQRYSSDFHRWIPPGHARVALPDRATEARTECVIDVVQATSYLGQGVVFLYRVGGAASCALWNDTPREGGLSG